MRSKTHLNPLTPKSDQHLISHEKKENDHQLKEALDREKNYPCQHLRKCLENSMENIHSDVTVKGSRTMPPSRKKVLCYWC